MGSGSTAGGRFIVLEGPDGAGKSSQADRLAAWLRERGADVVQTREPGGSALGEAIRGILLDPAAASRDALSDALLFSAARHQHVVELIGPALERGASVVCDRFSDSTLAYQGYGSGLELDALRGLADLATGGIRPDLVILLDLPVEIGLARRAGGDPTAVNRFEDASRHDRAYHERVRRGFLALAGADPERWIVVDATGEPGVVERSVRAALDARWPSGEPIGPPARTSA